jgi:hypothetical protein
MTWSGCVAWIGKKNTYRILVGKPKRMNYEEHRHRWEDNVKMNLIRQGGMDWTNLIQDRDQWRPLGNMLKTLRFHKMLGNS